MMNKLKINALLWCNKTTRSQMRVIVSHKGMLEAREKGKWQPTCVKRMTLGMDDKVRTYAFKVAFTLPTLFLVIGTMALHLIFIAAVLWSTLGSVQVAVLGFPPRGSLPTYTLSALVNDENSSCMVLLSRAFYALIYSDLPLAPLPKAFFFS